MEIDGKVIPGAIVICGGATVLYGVVMVKEEVLKEDLGAREFWRAEESLHM